MVYFLAWMLINTWVILIIAGVNDGSLFSQWDKYLLFFITSVIGIPTILVINLIKKLNK